MEQRTHTWLAIRTVALMDDLGQAPGLVRILKPFLKTTAIGAWIPDMSSARKGYGDIDNHVLKMEPYEGDQIDRFTVRKKKLLKLLGTNRLMHRYLNTKTKPDSKWWGKPYRADPPPGQHLANCAMTISAMLTDLLILGNPVVAKHVPGETSFAKNLDPNARSTPEQIATYFFMLSHFVADSCMPCHCDARILSGYSRGLHKELEEHWSKKIGTFFDKKKLLKTTVTPKKIIEKAKNVDTKFGITSFPTSIPNLKANDVWKEIINICRGSYAVANTIAPPDKYPPRTRKLAKFTNLFEDEDDEDLKELDKMVIHDSVLNIAIVWKDVWQTFD